MASRRSYREILGDKIRDLSRNGEAFVPNKVVRDALGWEEDRYWRIRQELIDDGVVVVRRGQGGKVGLVDTPDSDPLSIFISYAHADVVHKTSLLKHLEPLRRSGWVEAWHDGEITPGAALDATISSRLQAASIVVLLVSVDFISSIYCYEIELEKALERRAQGEAVVIPVILRSCMWRQTPLSNLLALPTDGKPIVSWSDQDDAWTNVVEGLTRAVRELRDRT
jgi:hypothetical protein